MNIICITFFYLDFNLSHAKKIKFLYIRISNIVIGLLVFLRFMQLKLNLV